MQCFETTNSQHGLEALYRYIKHHIGQYPIKDSRCQTLFLLSLYQTNSHQGSGGWSLQMLYLVKFNMLSRHFFTARGIVFCNMTWYWVQVDINTLAFFTYIQAQNMLCTFPQIWFYLKECFKCSFLCCKLIAETTFILMKISYLQ